MSGIKKEPIESDEVPQQETKNNLPSAPSEMSPPFPKQKHTEGYAIYRTNIGGFQS